MTPTGVRQMKVQKFWFGSVPKSCDICCSQITTNFVDGLIVLGAWANVCLDCHKKFGCGLGVGKGQKYEKQPNGKFLKIAG